jgi:WD40 repeat protein
MHPVRFLRKAFIWAALIIPATCCFTEVESKALASEPALAEFPEPAGRTDLFGDPLPDRALARMGSALFYHGNQVSALAYSLDGQYLASSSDTRIPTVSYNCIRLWDARRGGQLQQLRGHFVTDSLAFAPNSSYLISKGSNRTGAGEVCVWEVCTGAEYCHFQASCYALSPDGKSLALAKLQETGASIISIRQLDTCRLLDEFRVEKTIFSLLFSADGESLIAGEAGGWISAWDYREGKELRRLGAHQFSVRELALSPDGRVMLSRDAGGMLAFWNPAIWRFIAATRPNKLPSRDGLAFSPDGRFVAAPWNDGIKIWSIPTGTSQTTIAAKDAQSVAFSPDGKALAWGGDGKVIHFSRDIEAGRPRTEGPSPGPGVQSIAFSRDARRLATSGQGAPVRLWETDTGKELRSSINPVFEAAWRLKDIWALGFSADGKRLHIRMTGPSPALVQWDLSTGKEIRRLSLPPCPAYPDFHSEMVSVSPDGMLAAIGGYEGTLRTFAKGELGIWDLAIGKEVSRLDAEESTVKAVAFSPDGRMLAAGHLSGILEIWEVATRQKRLQLNGHRQSITSLAFSADGQFLASGSDDRTALVWDLFGLRNSDFEIRPPGMNDLSKFEVRSSIHSAFDAAWQRMGAGNAAEAYEAMSTFIRASGFEGRRSKVEDRAFVVDYFRQYVKPTPRLTREMRDRIADLVAELDRREFTVRDRAEKELLEKFAEVATPTLKSALWRKPSPEARRRIGRILDELEHPKSPDILGRLRAVEVLEHMARPDSRQLLESLASGEPTSGITQAAKASLERKSDK